MRIVTGLGLAMMLAAGASAQTPAADPPPSAYAQAIHPVALPDGRRINMACMGQGSPTVVMTAGLGSFSLTFVRVQTIIAKTTRVCAWDRAGFGFSDGSAEPQDAVHTEADLEQALAAGAIAGPYVIVGHSAGAFESLLFADRHPLDVAGMVLIDPSFPGQHRMEKSLSPALYAADKDQDTPLIRSLRACAADLRAGKAPDLEKDCGDHFPEVSARLTAALMRLDRIPERLEAKASQYEQFEHSSEETVNPTRGYGAMPLIVLTAEDPMPLPPELKAVGKPINDAWIQAHDKLAALSTRGINRMVPGSGHSIQRDKPEAVIAAVDEVISAARAARP
jgi:pimeloyl-ACP methyl ester carboxylesterase